MVKELTALDASVEVQITDTAILAPNNRRVSVTVVNQGSNDVWLRKGATAVADTGIYLKASGGAHTWEKATTPWYGSLNGIADTVASKLTVEEIEEVA